MPSSISIPQFKSDIPEHLLVNSTPEGRYIIETIAVLNRKTDWQSEQLVKQAEVQGAILEQALETNGGLIKAKADIIELQAVTQQVRTELGTFSTILKVISTKWFWAATVIILLGVVPYVYAQHWTLHQLFKIVTSALGM